MPRTRRLAPGGIVFHVLNRGNQRQTIFENAGDYQAFLRVMSQSQRLAPMRVLAYALMPNHWHLVVWPVADGDLARFMQRLTVTHVRRWREHRHSVGQGHLYQGVYKSFPIAEDGHFLQACRYVERNALRAGLAPAAAAWPWASLAQRESGKEAGDDELPLLSPWPVDRPRNWRERVSQPESQKELEAMRWSVLRGRPLGPPAWVAATSRALGLTQTLRERGRPPKPRSGAGE
jgi:putative transposase